MHTIYFSFTIDNFHDDLSQANIEQQMLHNILFQQ